MPADHKVLIRDATRECWLAFSQPRHIYSIDRLDDVMPTLAQVQANVQEDGLWAAGWISYEASPAFDSALKAHAPTDFPVLWFGLFEHCEQVSVESMLSAEHVDVFQQTVWSLNSDLSKYAPKIEQIKNEIKKRQYLPGQLHNQAICRS